MLAVTLRTPSLEHRNQSSGHLADNVYSCWELVRGVAMMNVATYICYISPFPWIHGNPSSTHALSIIGLALHLLHLCSPWGWLTHPPTTHEALRTGGNFSRARLRFR